MRAGRASGKYVLALPDKDDGLAIHVAKKWRILARLSIASPDLRSGPFRFGLYHLSFMTSSNRRHDISQQTPDALYNRSVYQVSAKLDRFAPGRRPSHWLGQTERRYCNHMRAQLDRHAEWHAPIASIRIRPAISSWRKHCSSRGMRRLW